VLKSLQDVHVLLLVLHVLLLEVLPQGK